MLLVLSDDNHILCEAVAIARAAYSRRLRAVATAHAGGAAVTNRYSDVCLLDFCLHQGGDGLSPAQAIWDKYPDTAVLVLSGLSERAAALVAEQIGAARFPDDDQEFDRIAAVLDVITANRAAPPVESPPAPEPGSSPPFAGDPLSTLTPREAEVLGRIAAGQSTKKMACEMNVTTETLRTYVKKVLAKLGAHSRLEAATLATRQIASGQPGPAIDQPLFATLTPREREVLAHLTKGSELREVAKQLHMSLRTVNTHLHNLRGKLGVHSTVEAVAMARARLGQRPGFKDPGRPSPQDRDERPTLSDGAS